jgi:copper chaperone CopZ
MKSKFFYISSLIFAVVFTVSHSVFAQNSKEPSPAVSQNQKLQTIKIKVSGITCSGDCKDIQKAVSKIDGVSSCKQIGKPSATSVFQISFNPAVVSEKEIRRVVEDTPGCDNPDEKPYKVKQG